MSRHPSRSDDFFQALQGYGATCSSTGAQSSENSPATPQYPPYHQTYSPQQSFHGLAYQNDLQFQQFQAFQQFQQQQQSRMNPTLQSTQRTQPAPVVETQPEPAQETQPGPSRKSRGKGKTPALEKVIKKPKQPWSSAEEKLLAECWLDVSEDPHVGISQTGETFWNKVFANYNAQAPIKRRMDQISGKWRLIKEQVGKFNSIWNKYDKDRRSGENDAQVMEEARKAYSVETGGKFTMYDAWMILKDKPKFLAFIGVDGMVRRKRVSVNIDDSDDDQPPINLGENEPIDTDLFGPDAIPRPTKPKTKTPRTSGSSDAGSSRSSASDLAARLELLGSSKHELIETRKDALAAIREEERKRTMYAALSFVGQSNPNRRQRKFIQKAMDKVLNEYKDFVELSDAEDEDE